MYRRTSKNEQIRANEGYNEEHNNTVEKSQQKKERIQIPMKITSLLSQKRNIIFFSINIILQHSKHKNHSRQAPKF